MNRQRLRIAAWIAGFIVFMALFYARMGRIPLTAALVYVLMAYSLDSFVRPLLMKDRGQ